MMWLQSAVERQFEIIGEDLNQALKLDPSLATAISRSADIVAFRNLRASWPRSTRTLETSLLS